MVKEYYNLEKVAEVLSVPTAEVNRLREQNKLRGFRDGGTWKFLKEEVHTYLAEMIKARGGAGQNEDDDSDFDLGDEDSSFDLLVEDSVLPDDFDLISISPNKPKSDLDLAAMDEASELALAEETQISSLVIPKREMTEKPKSTPQNSEPAPDDELSSDLILAEDMESSAISLESDSEVHEVELDEDSVMAASSSSPQLGLAGDSGFDVLLAAAEEVEFEAEIEEEDSSALLMVDSENTEAIFVEEFALEPPPSMADDDSESSSQIIAIDVGMDAAIQENAFNQDDFGGFGGFGAAEFDEAEPSQPAAAAISDPFGSAVSAQPDAFGAPLVSVSPARKASQQEEYSTGMLIALVSALVVMLLPGMMLVDTMAHLWSWGDPFVLNSVLMGAISGLLGL